VQKIRILSSKEEKLAQLWKDLHETLQEYTHEVEETTRLFTGTPVDAGSMKQHHDNERVAYRKYRTARRALLAALFQQSA
jgi:hypothetical protein